MTECPDSARRAATVPPPAPEPTTMYSVVGVLFMVARRDYS
jgi:hypothetical protein